MQSPSPSIRLERASFAWSGARPLLADLSFHLASGWTGVVGANGAGKSTLLGLISGEIEPLRGLVRREPPGLALHACPQRVESPGPAEEAFAAAWDGPALKLRDRLRLGDEDFWRWESLSPGERKRWQVGAALWADPGALLLDEPTNHLDAEGRELLVAALARFRGIGLVVSHDRALLDALTAHTLRVADGTARLWKGGYTAAKAAWEAEAAGRVEAHAQARRREEGLRRQLAEQRQRQQAADTAASTRKRMKGIHDHDARDAIRKKHAADGQKRQAQRAGLLRREVERAAAATAAFEIRKEKGRSLFVDYGVSPTPWLLALESTGIYAGERRILGETRLALGRRDRVHLAGPNGAGKTTLLRALLESAPNLADRVLYLPQELSAAEGDALLAALKALSGDARARRMELLAALGVDPAALLASVAPSPGEARKLLLAEGLARQVWALLLDEPTNHLDLPSIERLEAMLAAYPGALLLISHDDALAARCCETVWSITPAA